VHFPIDHTGVVGLPVPGCELKLLPNQGKLEARVRGPHVTPGYWREPALTQAAFDEEGFYRMGDALRFNNPARPEEGLVFDGRTAENFKLNTGTWVHVGELRMAVVAACNPLIQDAVVTGHDRDEIGVLLFVHPNAAEPVAEIRRKVAQALQAMNQGAAGSSARVARALVLNQGPRLDLGEITDKGYVNQRMVLTLRAAVVQQLYDDSASDVIFPSGTPSKQKAISP
jgi:feruloyl-CoA synthase